MCRKQKRENGDERNEKEEIDEEKTSKEIGDELHLSMRTVEEYRQRIKDKMEVKGSTGIVIYAIKNDLFKVQEYE